jgi:hypothetical protein
MRRPNESLLIGENSSRTDFESRRGIDRARARVLVCGMMKTT